MYNLAGILRAMGRYEETLSLVEEALELSKETFGEKHPLTITIMSGLSKILSNLGRDEEALKLTEQVFTLRKEVFGKWHVETIMAMHYLAEELQEAGRHQEAAALWKERIEMIFTSDENDTVNADNLRDYFNSKFDTTDEYDLYGTLQILNPMIHLAKALLDAGEKDEALSWADHALKFGEKIFPVLAESNDEFYEGINFNTGNLRKWHDDFLKKLRGEYVEPVKVKKRNLRIHATRAIPFDEED